jgi:hypothetical protein
MIGFDIEPADCWQRSGDDTRHSDASKDQIINTHATVTEPWLERDISPGHFPRRLAGQCGTAFCRPTALQFPSSPSGFVSLRYYINTAPGHAVRHTAAEKDV